MSTRGIKSDKPTAIKRSGKTLGVGELVSKLIDPALKKRGFASRDILENWHIIAPPPYNKVTIPDQLKWRRGISASDGAILILRCHEGHRLALAHDHERIVAAVNRYFGYVLVEAVKLSAHPFSARSDTPVQIASEPSPQAKEKVNAALCNVEDNDLKQALAKLGYRMMKRP
ncbi:MAG: DciA family protein [Devosiaceae bacterium]|nr:DciA family protein [Devosiaceae bacterium]